MATRILLHVLLYALGVWYGLWYAGNNTGMTISTVRDGACVTGLSVDRIDILLPWGSWSFPYGATAGLSKEPE